jgi:hypothetical protein
MGWFSKDEPREGNPVLDAPGGRTRFGEIERVNPDGSWEVSWGDGTKSHERPEDFTSRRT